MYHFRYELSTIIATVAKLRSATPSITLPHCLPAHSASSQEIVFDTLPVNQTVVEGGDATFACSGTVDGTSQPTRYRIRSGVTVLQSVGGNISALSAVDGIEAALVFGDFNSQVLLRNITREANGYTVSCAILVGAVFLDAIYPPTTFITVLCKRILH